MNEEKTNDTFWNQLSNVVTMAAKEDQIIWAIFGVFWAANAVLLVALFTTGAIPNNNVVMIISFVGLVLSFIWFFIQRRAIKWLIYYETLINRIEDELKIPDHISLSAHKNKNLFDEKVGKGVRVRKLMIRSGVVSTFVWLIIFIVFTIKVIC
jgi:hypothetical protein